MNLVTRAVQTEKKRKKREKGVYNINAEHCNSGKESKSSFEVSPKGKNCNAVSFIPPSSEY